MKYFCEKLNNELTCFHDKIQSCCSGWMGPVYYEEYSNEKINWDRFLEIKNESFGLMDDENIEKLSCKECFYLRPRKEEDVIKCSYKMLHISHWTQCNCGCIYCARIQDSSGEISEKPKKSNYYNMLPVLKGLYKYKLLDKENLIVVFQGGDISVLKEFESLVKECYKNGFKEAYILTNNIIYQPIIKRLLKDNKASLTTSLDAGTKETYLKLKRVDKFDATISNLKKYVKEIKEPNITVRYILIEGYNDNFEESEKFLNLMTSIGIKNVEFQIDNKYGLFTDLDRIPLPSNYGQLYNFFRENCHELGLNFLIEDRTKYVVEKYALNIITK